MILLSGRDKVKTVEQKIVKDLSEKIGKNVKLPYEFSAPKKVENSKCEVKSPVITINDIDYPQDIFVGYGYLNNSLVAFIKSDYNDMGLCSLYETLSGEYIGGIRDKSGIYKDLNECVNELKFEIDLKTMKYKQIKANEKTENPSQMGE